MTPFLLATRDQIDQRRDVENERDLAAAEDGSALVAARHSFAEGAPQSNFAIISDGFARRGDYAKAAGILRGAVRENPEDSDAWLAMAGCQQEMGNAAAARRSLETLVAKYPNSPAADTAQQRLKKK